MLFVQNRIQLNEGFEHIFEDPNQDGQGEDVPGRIYFGRLKSDAPGVYINLSIWESREAFETWRGSESFKRAHSRQMPEGAIAGRPQLTIAEVLYSEGSLVADHG